MTIRVRVGVGDVSAIAELDDAASPEAVAALVATLPLRGEMLSSMWSGHAAELSLPDELRPFAGGGAASVDIGIGTLAIGVSAEGPVLVIAYGPAKFHTATGPVPATRVGRLVENTDGLLAKLERTFDEGAFPAILEERP